MSDKVGKRGIDTMLTGLRPEARARVEDLLKSAIEKEIAVSGGRTGQAESGFTREHDRGPLFGRDFDKSSSQLEDIRALSGLSEQEFENFAARVERLRGGGR